MGIDLFYEVWGEKYLIWLSPWNTQKIGFHLLPPTSYVINNIKWKK